jgi:hypothetical protein
MLYTLILFVTIGPLSDRDSMALTNVVGFKDQAACETAGRAAVAKFGAGTKRADFICAAVVPASRTIP